MEGGVIEVTSAMHYEARQTLHVNNSVPLILANGMQVGVHSLEDWPKSLAHCFSGIY